MKNHSSPQIDEEQKAIIAVLEAEQEVREGKILQGDLSELMKREDLLQQDEEN